MSKYNGYIINGCRYHTKERDELRTTQNSGVSVVAATMQIASKKRIRIQYLVSYVFMGSLLRFGILITLCSEFQFSSVTGLTQTTALKLMNLALHWFT